MHKFEILLLLHASWLFNEAGGDPAQRLRFGRVEEHNRVPNNSFLRGFIMRGNLVTGGGPRIWPLVIMLLLVSIIPISTSSLSNVLAAVSPKRIMSDNTLPTPTTVNPVGNLYNINGGTISGTNQFHSFDVFSVGPGDIASFNGPIGITNILGRVTGLQSGLQVSSIYGTIQSTIPGANLFLMNPADSCSAQVPL